MGTRIGKPNFTARFVTAVEGLRIRKAHDGTDGSQEDHWRLGILTRPSDTPGRWMAKYEDVDEEEENDTGKDDLYDMNPLQPTKVVSLQLNKVNDVVHSVTVLSAFTGAMLSELPVTDQLLVRDLRAECEAKAGDANGVKMVLPSSR